MPVQNRISPAEFDESQEASEGAISKITQGTLTVCSVKTRRHSFRADAVRQADTSRGKTHRKEGAYMLSPFHQHPYADTGCAPRRRRVLIVDDQPDTLRSCANLLQVAGFEVATAADGVEALRVALQFQPATVLLDIELPGIDGFEVARRLRADATFKGLTIIAVSGCGSDEAREQAQAIGFDHYFSKPLHLSDLLCVLA
jgi:CheY-like chemotaxis protein